MRNVDLNEQTTDALSEARVDRESGVVHSAKICGRVSKNQRVYLKPVFRESIDLYDGAPFRIGHGKKGERPGFDDVIGTLKAPRVTDAGLFADIHVLDAGPRGRKFLRVAEAEPALFGISQEASGRIEPGGRGEKDRVRQISSVRGAALVPDPATTSSIFEGADSAAELVESLAGKKEKEADGQRLRELELREVARDELGNRFVEAEGADAVFRRAAKCGVSPEEFVEDWRNVLDASGGISASSSERDPDNLFPGPRDQFSSNGDDRDAEPGYGADDIFGEDGPDPRNLFT